MSFNKLCLSCTTKRKRRAGSIDSSTNSFRPTRFHGSPKYGKAENDLTLSVPSIFTGIEVDSPALLRPSASKDHFQYSQMEASVSSRSSSLETLVGGERSRNQLYANSASLSSISLSSSTCHLGNDPEASEPLLGNQLEGRDGSTMRLIVGDGRLMGKRSRSSSNNEESADSSSNHGSRIHSLEFRELNLRHVDSDSCCSRSSSRNGNFNTGTTNPGRLQNGLCSGVIGAQAPLAPVVPHGELSDSNEKHNSKTIPLFSGNKTSSEDDESINKKIKQERVTTRIHFMLHPVVQEDLQKITEKDPLIPLPASSKTSTFFPKSKTLRVYYENFGFSESEPSHKTKSVRFSCIIDDEDKKDAATLLTAPISGTTPQEQEDGSNEKPVSGSQTALDLASQSNVQDAFVIAVEQQARERLEKLSALKRIKPVDMTKLSQQLSEVTPGSGETSSELNGLIEAATGSPIYVTSVPELSSSQAALHRSTAGDVGEDAFTTATNTTTLLPSPSSLGRRESDTSPTVPLAGKQVSPSARRLSVDGITTARSPTLVNGLKQLQAGTSSTTGRGHQLKSDAQGLTTTVFIGSGGETQVSNGQYSQNNSVLEKVKTSPKQHVTDDLISKKSREDVTGSQESVEGTRSSTASGRGDCGSKGSSRESIVESAQYANMINMVEWDNGPHREMAVDVPESFVPRNKTPPRYPPKQAIPSSNNNKRSVVTKSGNGTSTLPGNGASVKPVPPPRINEKDGWSVNNNNPPQVSPRTIISPNIQQSPSVEQAERIRKYQEDLRKRREEEDRQAQEEEFLRTSLRGSKKLQALESVRALDSPSPLHTGFVNDAYETVSDDFYHHHDALLKKPIGISELVASLQRVQEALKKNGMQLEDTVSAVGSLMKKPEFQQVLAVHNKVQEVWCFNSPPTPISTHSHQILQECLGSLYSCSKVPESAELVDLLSRVALEGVFYAHDKIAERERLLLVSETPLNMGESVDDIIQPKSTRPNYIPEPQPDDHIKVVRLDKTQDPLGATVRNEGDAVIIGRIVKGGAAEKSGLLREGDEVLEVNGMEMRGKSVNEVCDILSRMTGTLTFLIIPDPGSTNRPPVSQRREILIHVRAHFDYDPEDDIYVPCRELGIAFSKGDVLHVISQDDPNWWQAHREGEEDQALAGLIPSKSFQEQREAVKQTLLGETETREKSKRGTLLLCAKTHKKKKKKIPYSAAFNDDFDAEEIPTYEEVALYYPRASFKRPVVLIGPPNIGRHELRQRLMQLSDRFAAAVPHTSRSRKEGEIDGQDYHFITRAQFEADILGRKFVEHGEFEKAYYGTSLDAIRSVVNIGRICVLNLHPQSLKILRNSDLKPYIVFVAPPPLERLKQLRISRGEAYKEDELIDIIEKAREMEEKYGHYFDLVIINNDIERTYHELVQRINYIEREPQWVPAFWLKQ